MQKALINNFHRITESVRLEKTPSLLFSRLNNILEVIFSFRGVSKGKAAPHSSRRGSAELP